MRTLSRRLGQVTWTIALTLLTAAALTIGLPRIAHATMTSGSAASSSTWSTLTVAAATGLGATPSCGPTGSLTTKVTLAWTPSTTSRLTSQGVLRRIGSTGPFTLVTTLTPTASSYVDSGLPLLGTTYNYEIRSAVSGFVTDTAPVSATTPAVCI